MNSVVLTLLFCIVLAGVELIFASNGQEELPQTPTPNPTPPVPKPTCYDPDLDCVYAGDACARVDAYLGDKHMTADGQECDEWDSRGEDGEDNLCRNPDSDVRGPWCYIKDPNADGLWYWGYCFRSCAGKVPETTTKEVPETTTKEVPETTPTPLPMTTTTMEPVEPKPCYEAERDCWNNGPPCHESTSYLGDKWQTKSGLICLPWNETEFAGENHLVSNYCRNPDNDTDGPWCYTTEPTNDAGLGWEHCFRSCDSVTWAACYDEARDCIHEGENCARKDVYKGDKHTTRWWRACIDWDLGKYADEIAEGVVEKNFCRNPDADEDGPWCHTAGMPGWEYCFRKCPD